MGHGWVLFICNPINALGEIGRLRGLDKNCQEKQIPHG